MSQAMATASAVPRRVGVLNATSGFSDDERALRARLYARFFASDVEVTLESIEGGPKFFDRGEHFAEALRVAEEYLAGYDWSRFGVVIWAGAIDPGLQMVRSFAPVPVVGPGESAMFFGSIMNRPLSVVTVDEHAVAVTKAMLDSVRVKPPIVSIRSMDTPVREIVADRERGREAVTREAKAAAKDGAEVVYLGSMTLGTLGVDESLRSEGLAVLNPLHVAAHTASRLLESRTTSRK